jgi:Uma2 family endonuclease
MVAIPYPPVRRPLDLTIAWVKPPVDYRLDDTPVENDRQPLLAGALRESLELSDRLPPSGLVVSNFGLCLQINDDLVLKAPDWLYVGNVKEPGLDRTSYTPHLEGDVPSVVMEFLSDDREAEYSIKRTSPYGKWFFYEQMLKVPTYVIFEPDSGLLEVYRLTDNGYDLEQPNEIGHHWFEALGLSLGTWRGQKEGRSGYWLRWWDQSGEMLPWGVELVQKERDRAEQERDRADRLTAYLISQGLDPNNLPG